MKDVELAYFAGIVDGEGCISGRFYSTGLKAGWHPRLLGKLQVTNTNKELIDWILASFGGHVSIKRRTEWKTCYEWQTTMQQAAPILRQILPYLRMKRRQAEMLIELSELSLSARDGRKRGLDPHNFARRVELVAEFRVLNARGPSS